MRRKKSHIYKYTLPYREETGFSFLNSPNIEIHPPMQGGNDSFRKQQLAMFDTPSHAGRKRMVEYPAHRSP